MPKQLKKPAAKKRAADHLVEISLQVSNSKLSLVTEALKAVMALAGQEVSLEQKTEQAHKEPKAQKTQKTQKKQSTSKAKAKTAPAKKAQPAAARPARGRGRPAAEKKAPASPETAAMIRDLRTKAGLSQKGLADKLKVSQNQISLLETARQALKPDLAKKLDRLFKTSFPV